MSAGKPAAESGPVIAIIGLGWLGQSLGHALQRVKTRYTLVGHDREPALARAAREAGAIDRADWNLLSAVADADLVFLTEPLEQSCRTLAQIAPELRPGSLVTDTAPRMARLLALAEQHLPAGVSYVGGHPALRPPAGGKPEADASLAAARFENATWCLAPLPSASDTAVSVLTRLVTAVGAKPRFFDPLEHDSLQTGVGLTPFLTAMALLRQLGASPSAEDFERLGGAYLLGMVDLSQAEAEAWLSAVREDREGVAGWLDQTIGALAEMRSALREDPARFEALLAEAETLRRRWCSPSETVDPMAAALADVSEQGSLRHMLFGRLGRRDEGGAGA